MDTALIKWNASCIVTFTRTSSSLSIQLVSTMSQKEDKTKQNKAKKNKRKKRRLILD